jgi:hypothetical protein
MYGRDLVRNRYKAFYVLEGLLLLVIVLILVLPIQDYSLTEFKEFYRHPSPQSQKAFLEKRQEEFQLRATIAVPLVVLATLLAVPLLRSRPKSSK